MKIFAISAVSVEYLGLTIEKSTLQDADKLFKSSAKSTDYYKSGYWANDEEASFDVSRYYFDNNIVIVVYYSDGVVKYIDVSDISDLV